MPVLILTARGEEADKVLGLDWGADDYVTKPFGTQELLARVRALLRRPQPQDVDAGSAIGRERFGDVEVDPAAHTVLREGEPISLTPKEFDLLHLLVSKKGKPLWENVTLTSSITGLSDIFIVCLLRFLKFYSHSLFDFICNLLKVR